MSSLWRPDSRMLNWRYELGDMAILMGCCLETMPCDSNDLGVAPKTA
jgi:hypothetical protein